MTKTRRFQVELEVEFEEPDEGEERGDCSLKDVQCAFDYSSAAEALSIALGGYARLNVQGQYRYTLNGEPVDLDAFLAENRFDDDEQGEDGPVGQIRDAIASLVPGRSFLGSPGWCIHCRLEED